MSLTGIARSSSSIGAAVVDPLLDDGNLLRRHAWPTGRHAAENPALGADVGAEGCLSAQRLNQPRVLPVSRRQQFLPENVRRHELSFGLPAPKSSVGADRSGGAADRRVE
jgi:hypothetical protein